MKSIVILYDEKSPYETLALHDGKNALQLTKTAFESIDSLKGCGIKTIEGPKTFSQLLEEICSIVKAESCDTVVFSYADCPFINKDLTEKILNNHSEFKAEYSFADGYPYGFSPEVLNAGTLNILNELAKTTQVQMGNKKFEREGIFELIKTDINAFEIETVLSDTDWRLLRYAFHCGKKENYFACKALFDVKNTDDAEELSKIASENKKILKTLPGFYNIQICDGVNYNTVYTPYAAEYEKVRKVPVLNNRTNMDFDKFSKLIDSIAGFSAEAVVGLSAWGEALNHPQILDFVEKVLSYKGLSVFIETDGYNITDEIASKLGELASKAEERTNGWNKIMIAVTLDAFTKEKFIELHGDDGLEKAKLAVQKLEAVLPGSVYPMFTRINENEEELEAFFRFWNEKTSPSSGEMIIQKYEDFAGLLPDRRPADLSPLERNVCWHLRRDLTIYSNGDVPLCRTCLFENIIGNVFEQSLEEIWEKSNECVLEHVQGKYNEKCGRCHDFYTFNF